MMRKFAITVQSAPLAPQSTPFYPCPPPPSTHTHTNTHTHTHTHTQPSHPCSLPAVYVWKHLPHCEVRDCPFRPQRANATPKRIPLPRSPLPSLRPAIPPSFPPPPYPVPNAMSPPHPALPLAPPASLCFLAGDIDFPAQSELLRPISESIPSPRHLLASASSRGISISQRNRNY